MRSSGQLLPTWTKKKTFITAENKRNIRTILHQRQILSRHLLCLSVVKLDQLGFIFFLSRSPIWNWKTGGAKAPVDSWSRGRWAVWSVVEPAGSAFSCALCEPLTFVAFLEKLMSQDFIWCELQTKWQVMWRCILSVWGPSLTLLGLAGGREGGGIYAPPCHVFAITPTWLFPIISLEKGSMFFTP